MVHESYSVTDDKQTTDDWRAIAYSEREREFTFAKRTVQILPNFLDILRVCVAVARSYSDCNEVCYLLPVLWMSSCFT